MQQVSTDFIGPITQNKRRNISILFVLESSCKFVSFYAVRRIAASVVLKCLNRSYFPAYGAPNSIVTENASVFRSKRAEYKCFRWWLVHIFTKSYYPQRSLTERVIRNIKIGVEDLSPPNAEHLERGFPIQSFRF